MSDVVGNVTSDGVDVTFAAKLMQTRSYVQEHNLRNHSLWLDVTYDVVEDAISDIDGVGIHLLSDQRAE